MHADLTIPHIDRRPGVFEKLALRGLARVRAGGLQLHRHDGSCLSFEGREPGPQAIVSVRDPRAYRRFLLGGDIALAESYMDGDWDTPDLDAVLRFGAINGDRLADTLKGRLGARAWRMLAHALRPNSPKGARRNVAAHYDLGNAFYAAWLDPTLTYSAALFDGDPISLAAAQERKYRRMASLADIEPGHHVLEIGCGWGGFCTWAAREIGCRVTAITLSRAQAEHTRALVAASGLADRVDVQLRDYRHVDGVFDGVVSIEMLEAVGEAYWPLYFRHVRNALRPGGRAALQVITIADDRFAAYRRRVDFIQRYVFPGGMLPSPTVLRQRVTEAGLGWLSTSSHGGDYAHTLALWRQAFQDAEPRVAALGFDDRFRRMWLYYLAYCETGFREGRIDLLQIGLSRDGQVPG